MPNLYTQCEYVNATKGHSYGRDPEAQESFTDDAGELYRSCQSEFGRCKSRVYIDTKSRGTIAIGWVFEKRATYEDTRESYLQETWVTVFEECEHGDPYELTREHGRERCASGLKHKVLG